MLCCCCCPCLSNTSENEENEERSSLLHSSGQPQQREFVTYTRLQPPPPVVASTSDVEKSLSAENDKDQTKVWSPIVMKPVDVRSVNKRLQDHASLFNNHLDQWSRLNEQISAIEGMFPEQNPQHSLDGAFRHLKQICEKCHLISTKRISKFCLEVTYNGQECPYYAIPAFTAFNAANRLVKVLLENGPSLAKYLNVVVDNAKDLRREILVAGLGPREPVSMENCYEDVELLKNAIDTINEINVKVKAIFNELEKFHIGEDPA